MTMHELSMWCWCVLHCLETHRGFGFVEFESPEDAAAALENMNDSELFGRILRVNLAKPNAIKSQAVWAQNLNDDGDSSKSTNPNPDAAPSAS